MLSRNFGTLESEQDSMWQMLDHGAPTIFGFADLCSRAMNQIPPTTENLSPEAETILVASSQRGTMDIRASREPFDSAERFLAVCVEIELDRRLLFLNKSEPRQTIRFLEGFLQLCQSGYVIHHLQKDFSLSVAGFEAAEKLNRCDFEELLNFAVEIEH